MARRGVGRESAWDQGMNHAQATDCLKQTCAQKVRPAFASLPKSLPNDRYVRQRGQFIQFEFVLRLMSRANDQPLIRPTVDASFGLLMPLRTWVNARYFLPLGRFGRDTKLVIDGNLAVGRAAETLFVYSFEIQSDLFPNSRILGLRRSARTVCKARRKRNGKAKQTHKTCRFVHNSQQQTQKYEIVGYSPLFSKLRSPCRNPTDVIF